MPARSSTLSNASGNSGAYALSDNRERTITTDVPGRCIHASKLVDMLKTRFGDNYTLEVCTPHFSLYCRHWRMLDARRQLQNICKVEDHKSRDTAMLLGTARNMFTTLGVGGFHELLGWAAHTSWSILMSKIFGICMDEWSLAWEGDSKAPMYDHTYQSFKRLGQSRTKQKLNKRWFFFDISTIHFHVAFTIPIWVCSALRRRRRRNQHQDDTIWLTLGRGFAAFVW